MVFEKEREVLIMGIVIDARGRVMRSDMLPNLYEWLSRLQMFRTDIEDWEVLSMQEARDRFPHLGRD